MIEVQVFIPVTDNTGYVFTDRDHAEFEAYVLALAGGFTLNPARATGLWDGESQRYMDATRIYSIAIASITKGEIIAHIVDFARVHYRQEAIFIRYLGISEIL